MRALPSLTSLWPGLAALWVHGRWEGLIAAVAFGLVLNLALLGTFVPEILPTPLSGTASRAAAWLLVLGFWMAGWWVSRSSPNATTATVDARQNEWFCQAQTEYLKGHWVEAEMLLAKSIARDPADAEARLLLASVQRRTRRLAEARATLGELAEISTASRWVWEIHTEQEAIGAIEKQQDKSEGSEGEPLARAA
jgi:hypothetical protein